MKLCPGGLFHTCIIAASTVLAACSSEPAPGLPLASDGAADASDLVGTDGGVHVTWPSGDEWFNLDLSVYQEAELSPLIASHQTVVTFPLDLSQPNKLVTHLSPADLLRIQSKTPCGVAPDDNLVRVMEREVVAANVPVAKAARVQSAEVWMPFTTITNDGIRRGPGRVCYGFRSKGKWVWRMQMIEPVLNAEQMMGVAHLDVQHDDVDAMAVLFQDTSHVQTIGVKVASTGPVRRWALPPGRTIGSDGTSAAAGKTHAAFSYLEQETPHAAKAWLTVQDVSYEGHRLGRAFHAEITPSGDSTSIATDGQRFVVCTTSVGAMCFLHRPGAEGLVPVFETTERAERVVVLRAIDGWVVAWSHPYDASDASQADELVVQHVDENFRVGSRTDLAGAIGGTYRWFGLAASRSGFVVASGDPVVVQHLDLQLQRTGTPVNLGIATWFYPSVAVHAEDIFLSVGKPYGAKFLRIHGDVVRDTWEFQDFSGSDKAGSQVMFDSERPAFQAFWEIGGGFHVQGLSPQQAARPLGQVSTIPPYGPARSLISAQEHTLVVATSWNEMSVLTLP